MMNKSTILSRLSNHMVISSIIIIRYDSEKKVQKLLGTEVMANETEEFEDIIYNCNELKNNLNQIKKYFGQSYSTSCLENLILNYDKEFISYNSSFDDKLKLNESEIFKTDKIIVKVT